ncbi:MAG: helix-turn-helix transcriptional regulator [Dysgonomonas sp.]
MQEKEQKISPIKSRILQFVDTLGISKRDFYKTIEVSRGTLESKTGITEDVVAKFIANYPEVNIVWLMTGKGEMIKKGDKPILSPKKPIAEEETRPRIPMDAAAGSLTVAADGITIDNCEQLPVIKAFARYDFTIFARGDSMEPEYNSGDELACIYIRNSSFIQWGRIHVIDTAQGILVKRIFDGGDSIICKSDNPNYPDFRIDKSEFYNVALVIGMIRRY